MRVLQMRTRFVNEGVILLDAYKGIKVMDRLSCALKRVLYFLKRKKLSLGRFYTYLLSCFLIKG